MTSKSDARTARRSAATARARTEARLLAERELLAARIRDGLAVSTPPESHNQPAESPVDGLARDIEFHNRESVFARLALLDGAIGRLRAGTYGDCDGCGEPVEPKRLEHDPATALCLECQAATEQPHRRATL